MNALAVALGGAFGALTRWALGRYITSRLDTPYPVGTLLVNLLGCFAFGLAFGMLTKRFEVRDEVSLFLLTGFMGSFTTFSTYAHETLHLWRTDSFWAGSVNFILHNVLGILFVFVGLWVTNRG